MDVQIASARADLGSYETTMIPNLLGLLTLIEDTSDTDFSAFTNGSIDGSFS